MRRKFSKFMSVLNQKMLILFVLSLGSAAMAVTGIEPDVAGKSGLSQAALEFLNSVNNGLGFYHGLPYIVYLTVDNFDATVLKSPNSWVIEFYQSWCGYCLRYSTTYKRFAKDLYEWRPVLKVAAVDCNFNPALCRRFGVIHVPTVKYLPPNFNNNYKDVVKLEQRVGNETRKTPADLRKDIVKELMNRNDLHMLHPYKGGLADLWNSLPKGYDWVVGVTDCENASTLGQELLLDYWHTNPVIIVPLRCTGSQLIADTQLQKNNFSSLYLLNREQTSATNRLLNDGPVDRADALTAMHAFFAPLSISVPKPFDPKSVPDLNITKEELIKYAETHSKGTIPFPHSGTVYQVDIEAAIDHSITNEVSQVQKIEGESFSTLVQYLELMMKYFPTVNNGKHLFKCLYDEIVRNGTTTGFEVLQTHNRCIAKHKPVYRDPNNGYLGCRGSLLMFRGFPCSMWMMFHTLQGRAYRSRDPNPRVVLDVMIGYVKQFFACQDCAQHFLGEAKKIPSHLNGTGEALLWLWKAHNVANKRLHGDQTEDPKYPKVQFPTPDVCSACHNADGTFNEGEVLKFLDNMYNNVDQHVWADFKHPPPSAEKLTQSEVIIDEEDFIPMTTTHLWAAHTLDITVTASLTGLALALLTLICLIFYRTNAFRQRLLLVHA